MLDWLRRFFYSDDPIVGVLWGVSEPEARMVEELLRNNGIVAMAKNKAALAVTYQLGQGPNDFDVYVKQSDLERAREVLGRKRRRRARTRE